MIAVYVAALLFGGGLIAGSFLGGGDHDGAGGDADAGGGGDFAGHLGGTDATSGAGEVGGAAAVSTGTAGAGALVAGGGAAHVALGDGASHGGVHGGGGALWFLLGLRFWSFSTAFFGLTGLVLRAIAGPGLGAVGVVVSAGVGVASGVTASRVFGKLTREAVGQVRSGAALIGREGRLLLPVTRGQRGKIRLALPAGGHLDLIAETVDDDPLSVGTDALVVELKGSVAIVARSPAGLPPAVKSQEGE